MRDSAHILDEGNRNTRVNTVTDNIFLLSTDTGRIDHQTSGLVNQFIFSNHLSESELTI